MRQPLLLFRTCNTIFNPAFTGTPTPTVRHPHSGGPGRLGAHKLPAAVHRVTDRLSVAARRAIGIQSSDLATARQTIRSASMLESEGSRRHVTAMLEGLAIAPQADGRRASRALLVETDAPKSRARSQSADKIHPPRV